MRRVLVPTLFAMACLASATATQAGTVDVTFVKPETFSDVRDEHMRRDDILKTLGDHIKMLGQKQLPASQSLSVEVLDVDLAGESFPRVSREVRVLKGRADWPRMHVRYTLRDGDKVIRQGDDQLSDMNYLMDSIGAFKSEPLPYEKRMIDKWFKDKIVASAS